MLFLLACYMGIPFPPRPHQPASGPGVEVRFILLVCTWPQWSSLMTTACWIVLHFQEEDEVPDDETLNQMIARREEEFDLFMVMCKPELRLPTLLCVWTEGPGACMSPGRFPLLKPMPFSQLRAVGRLELACSLFCLAQAPFFFSSLFGCPLPVQKSILISGCLGETRWGQLARPTSRGGNRWLELRRQLRLLDKAMRSSFPSTAPLPASHPQPAQSGNLPGSLKCFCVEMSLSALAGAEPVFFLAGQVNSKEHNAVVSLP